MRKCPYCGGKMQMDRRGFLVCLDLCQHRVCAECGESIHRGGLMDEAYYDQYNRELCSVDNEHDEGYRHRP